jgi:hypothetical protein
MWFSMMPGFHPLDYRAQSSSPPDGEALPETSRESEKSFNHLVSLLLPLAIKFDMEGGLLSVYIRTFFTSQA